MNSEIRKMEKMVQDEMKFLKYIKRQSRKAQKQFDKPEDTRTSF